MATAAGAHVSRHHGTLPGFLRVTDFSATLPATRVAVAYLDPTLVGLGRSILAGRVAALLLWLTRQPLPSRQQFKSLAVWDWPRSRPSRQSVRRLHHQAFHVRHRVLPADEQGLRDDCMADVELVDARQGGDGLHVVVGQAMPGIDD